VSVTINRILSACTGALFVSVIWGFYLDGQKHFDYETCAELAGKNAEFSEALGVMMSSCASQYPGRRSESGLGYTFVDRESGLSFSIANPVPSEEERKQISDAVEAYFLEIEQERLDREKENERQERLRRVEEQNRREAAEERAREQEWERQECRKVNARKRQVFDAELENALSRVRVVERTIVTNSLFQVKSHPNVKVFNRSVFPIKSLRLRYQYMTLRGEYDRWENIICPSVPQYSWLAFNSRTSSLPAGGTMDAVVPDDLIVGRSAEYLLCVSLDTADFERPPLNLRACD
jgi:hypothetical protein